MTIYKQFQDERTWTIKTLIRAKEGHNYVQCVFNVDGTYVRKLINRKDTGCRLTEKTPYGMHAFGEVLIQEAEFMNRFANWLGVHQKNYAIDTRSKVEEFANLDNLGNF